MNIKLRCKACKWRDKAENLGEQKLDDIFAEDKETNKDGRIYNKMGADELTRTVGDNETGSAVLHEERANNGERIANGERGQQTLEEVSIESSDKADAISEDTRGRVEPDKAPEAVEPMSEGGFDIVATMPIVGNEDLINEYRKTINGTPTTYSFVPIARTASVANIIDSVWSRGGRVDWDFFNRKGIFNGSRVGWVDSMAIPSKTIKKGNSTLPDELLQLHTSQDSGANGQGLERAGADVSNSLKQGNDPFEEHRKILAEAKER